MRRKRMIYFEKEKIFVVEEKKADKEKDENIWRRKMSTTNYKQQTNKQGEKGNQKKG